MNSRFLMGAALGAALLANTVSAAERVGDFSLLDHQGYHHSMSWYDDHKTIALLVQANDSDASAAAAALASLSFA